MTVGNDDAQEIFSYYDDPLLSEIKYFINADGKEDGRNDAAIGVTEVKIIDNLLKSSRSKLHKVGN